MPNKANLYWFENELSGKPQFAAHLILRSRTIMLNKGHGCSFYSKARKVDVLFDKLGQRLFRLVRGCLLARKLPNFPYVKVKGKVNVYF